MKCSLPGSLIGRIKKVTFLYYNHTKSKELNDAETSKIQIVIINVEIDKMFISDKLKCGEKGRKYFMDCKKFQKWMSMWENF